MESLGNSKRIQNTSLVKNPRRLRTGKRGHGACFLPPYFQFVNVAKPWKDRNEHVVRSHAMKHVRRQRSERKAELVIEPQQELQIQQVMMKSLTSEYDQSSEITILWQPNWHNLPDVEQRLLHHLSGLYSPLLGSTSEKFVIWMNGARM